jgi:hypothetical protein
MVTAGKSLQCFWGYLFLISHFLIKTGHPGRLKEKAYKMIGNAGYE